MSVHVPPAADSKFVAKTLRQFAQMRDAGPKPSRETTPFPDDWFDLPKDTLADLGALFFLASLTKFQRGRSLASVFGNLEPALRLGQYKLFHSGGYPRAAMTWAGLGPEQERRFGGEHLPLRGEDWNSGPSVWLIDFFAPFGHFEQMIPALTQNPNVSRVRTLWHNQKGSRYRVIEWTREDEEGEIFYRSYGAQQFNRMMKGEHDGRS